MRRAVRRRGSPGRHRSAGPCACGRLAGGSDRPAHLPRLPAAGAVAGRIPAGAAQPPGRAGRPGPHTGRPRRPSSPRACSHRACSHRSLSHRSFSRWACPPAAPRRRTGTDRSLAGPSRSRRPGPGRAGSSGPWAARSLADRSRLPRSRPGRPGAGKAGTGRSRPGRARAAPVAAAQRASLAALRRPAWGGLLRVRLAAVPAGAWSDWCLAGWPAGQMRRWAAGRAARCRPPRGRVAPASGWSLRVSER